MSVLVRYTVLILLAMLMLTGVCLGKQVYLKDGGIIEGQSAWRQGDKVFVKVNRDIVADFNLSEIDLARTFPKATPARHHRHHTVKKHTALKSAASPKPCVRPNPPAPKPAVAPSPTVTPPTQKQVMPPPPPH